MDLVGQLLGDWQPQPAPTHRRAVRPDEKYRHVAYDSNQTQIGIAYRSVPYRHPDYFQAWGAVGVLSGGMSARLFTEVREKRGLCYSVYASYHTLLDRGGRVLLRRHRGRAGPGNARRDHRRAGPSAGRGSRTTS